MILLDPKRVRSVSEVQNDISRQYLRRFQPNIDGLALRVNPTHLGPTGNVQIVAERSVNRTLLLVMILSVSDYHGATHGAMRVVYQFC